MEELGVGAAGGDNSDNPPVLYDFFLAHASQDSVAAERLAHALKPTCRVFLDTEDVPPGVDWGTAIEEAQRRCRYTVAMVSDATRRSPYVMEEIRAAIDRERSTHGAHGLIPLYINGLPDDPDDFIYGLRTRQGLSIAGPAEFERAVRDLKALVAPAAVAAAVPASDSGAPVEADDGADARARSDEGGTPPIATVGTSPGPSETRDEAARVPIRGWRPTWNIAVVAACGVLVAVVLLAVFRRDDGGDATTDSTSPTAATAASVDSTAASVDSTAASVDSTAASVDSTAASVDATVGAVAPARAFVAAVNDRTVDLSPNYNDELSVMSITVPAGEWVVTASLTAIAPDYDDHVRCGLFRGAEIEVADHTTVFAGGANGGAPNGGITLLWKLVAESETLVDLRCDHDFDVAAGGLSIDSGAALVAFPADRVIESRLPDNSSPLGVTATKLLEIEVPAGRWAVLAKGSIVQSGAVEHVSCSLTIAGDSIDETTVQVGPTPNRVVAAPVNLAVVDGAEASAVIWSCSKDGDSEPYVDKNATLLAFSAEGAIDSGRQPALELGRSSGGDTEVWSAPLPSEHALLVGRTPLSATAAADTDSRCRFMIDETELDSHVGFSSETTGDPENVVNIVATADGGQARLSCQNQTDTAGRIASGSRVLAIPG